MARFVGIGEAARILGVSITTLRRWEASGKLVAEHTVGGHRRYDVTKLKPELSSPDAATNRRTVAYARVTSDAQRDDLTRQKQLLERYCEQKGWTVEVVTDRGSGVNYHNKGLRRLLDAIIAGQVERLVLTHKDRLLRLGAELVFAVCEIRRVEVVILNQSENSVLEEDLSMDMLDIVAVFSARLYSSRSPRNRKFIDEIRRVAEAARAYGSSAGSRGWDE